MNCVTVHLQTHLESTRCHELSQSSDQCLELVNLKVVLLSLKHRYHSLQSHASVNARNGQIAQFALCISVLFHKHKIPNLKPWIIQRCVLRVPKYLSARSTGPFTVSHCPKVIFGSTLDDHVVCQSLLFPQLIAFVVAFQNTAVIGKSESIIAWIIKCNDLT